MPEDTTQPQPTPKPKLINWKSILIGIIIGGLLVGIGMFFYYDTPPPNETLIVDEAPENVSTFSAKPIQLKDENASWQNYSNVALGISLKYPWDWDTTEFNGSPFFAPKEFIEQLKGIQEASKMMVISITQSDTETTYKNDEFGTVVKSTTNLAGNQATKYVVTYNVSPCCNISSGDVYTYIVVENKGKFVRVSLSDQTYVKTFETILSTFKFLD